MRAEDFRRLLAPLTRRVGAMVGRGTIAAVDDDRMAQELQIEGLDDETHDGVERMGDYGFTSHPPAGSEAATIAVGGTRSHQLVVGVVHRPSRPRGLRPGESALYDDQGQIVILRREGIEFHTDKPLKIFAESVLIEAETIDLGAEGGQPVARIGDTVEGGVITSGSDKVKAA